MKKSQSRRSPLEPSSSAPEFSPSRDGWQNSTAKVRQPGLVIGFHGCDRSIGEEILAGNAEVKASKNPYDWLGNGSYFWENSSERALEWARLLKKQRGGLKDGGIDEPFVVGAIIDPGLCLDLLEASCIDLVTDAHQMFADAMASSGNDLPINEEGYPGDIDLVKRQLDCATINFLHNLREAESLEPFDTVRCAFAEGTAAYEGARIQHRTHIQWCVRDTKRFVRGYFRPRKGS